MYELERRHKGKEQCQWMGGEIVGKRERDFEPGRKLVIICRPCEEGARSKRNYYVIRGP